MQSGQPTEAARVFESGRKAYLDRGDPLKAAELANNAAVAYLQAGMAEDALRLVEPTPAIFSEARDLKRQGMALGNQGSALEALKRNDEAIAIYQQSIEILRKAGEDQLQISVVQSLSKLQLMEGKQLQALASMQSGLQEIKKPNVKQSFLKRLINIPIGMMIKKR